MKTAAACLALGLWLAGTGSLGAATSLKKIKRAIHTSAAALNTKKEQIEKENERLKQQEALEGQTLRQLETLDQNLSVARNELRTHQHNLALVQGKLAEVGDLLQKDRASLALHQEALARRLVTIYKERSLDALALLLSSKDPAELLNRYRFLRALAAYNTRLLETTRQEIQRVKGFETEYSQKEKEIQELKEQAEASQAAVLDQKKNKRRLLSSIKRRKSRSEKTLAELQQAAEQLSSFIDKLEVEEKDLSRRQAFGPSGPTTLRGRGHWPVTGRVISYYGRQRHPQFGTWVFNKGIEVAAKEGTPIKAVASGKVLFADWFTGYGKMVILDHGGAYYTLYAHAGDLNVSKGDVVEAGQPIGEVGDSGSLGGPSLYFEVRKNGKAIDPLKWLKGR